jgi:diketogulonate reductase-like aldo/keto reductase
MGEDTARGPAEVAALRLALDLGVGLIDTAEMYGEGGAERIVGEAIRGRRGEAFLVSKFYPHHASRRKLAQSCEASLARLGVECIDLYLYHWRGGVPLAETIAALEELRAAGKIARWGVSNFDVDDLEELAALPGGGEVAADQVLYNLARRGPEFDLLPWCAARDIDVMAYSPFDEGPLARHPVLAKVAARFSILPGQVALAWLARHPGVCAIPKAVDPAHVHANAASRDIELDREALALLDEAFAPPLARQPLQMI